jgi:BCCT, betaine/carnitine/choline family transporter
MPDLLAQRRKMSDAGYLYYSSDLHALDLFRRRRGRGDHRARRDVRRWHPGSEPVHPPRLGSGDRRDGGGLAPVWGLDALRQAALLAGVPFAIIMILMCYSLYKGLREDFRDQERQGEITVEGAAGRAAEAPHGRVVA